jgi:hypothetical protein
MEGPIWDPNDGWMMMDGMDSCFPPFLWRAHSFRQNRQGHDVIGRVDSLCHLIPATLCIAWDFVRFCAGGSSAPFQKRGWHVMSTKKYPTINDYSFRRKGEGRTDPSFSPIAHSEIHRPFCPFPVGPDGSARAWNSHVIRNVRSSWERDQRARIHPPRIHTSTHRSAYN